LTTEECTLQLKHVANFLLNTQVTRLYTKAFNLCWNL